MITALRDKFALFIASGCYSGFAPKAPGTCGSLLGVGLLYVLSLCWPCFSQVDQRGCLLLLNIGVIILGTLASYIVMRADTQSKDPQYIVVDEWAGLALTYLLCPALLTSLGGLTLGFILFRFFDITKPGPVGWVEKFPGAFGVMADDCVAGIFAGLSALLLLYLQASYLS